MDIKFEQFSACKNLPIDGVKIIIPIMSSRGLLCEQIEQENCVYRFLDKILKGKYYVYKVITEERSTLGILINSSNKWEVDQLCLKNNKPVSKYTKLLVDNWISTSNRIKKNSHCTEYYKS